MKEGVVRRWRKKASVVQAQAFFAKLEGREGKERRKGKGGKREV